VPYFERAYQIRLAALGDAHPDTAQSIWWLGVIAESAGKIEEARTAYTQAHAIFERALGPNHPRTQQVFGFLNRLTP
jgi:Flp pilus assembly protein TadD